VNGNCQVWAAASYLDAWGTMEPRTRVARWWHGGWWAVEVVEVMS
jgi:hypothetical protein